MGRNSVFPKHQDDWIAAHIPDFLQKTAFGKTTTPGQPPGTDDPDLSQWVRRCREEFEVQFKLELDAESSSTTPGLEGETETFMESVRMRFDRKFFNAKSRAKSKFEKRRLQALTSTPLTARRLFEQFSRDTINNHVHAARANAQVDRQQHPGMYQAELKRRWDSLSDKEKKEYEGRATELNNKAGDGKQIYRNQEVFVGDLTNMLCDLIGDDKHQIGNASVHLLYGYRDAHGTLKTGSIAVRADPGDVSFDAFHSKYNEYTMTPWSHYCQEHVQYNKNLEAEATTIAPPVFPAFDEGTMTQDLRVVLRDYIEAQWSHARGLEQNTQMPWSDITGLLTSYLAADISSNLQMLDNPTHMSMEALFNTIGFIKSYQSRNGPFSIFRIQTPPPFRPPTADRLTPGLEPPEDPQTPPTTLTLPITTTSPFLAASRVTPNTAPIVATPLTTKSLELTYGGTAGVSNHITPFSGAATLCAQPVPPPVNMANASTSTNSPNSHTNLTTCELQTIPTSPAPPSPLSPPPSTPPPSRFTTTEVQNVKEQPSKKRKSDTLIKSSAKRAKGPILSNTGPRRSGRKKPSDPEPRDAVHRQSDLLPGNNIGMSRTGKPLKNNKNWVYVPRL